MQSKSVLNCPHVNHFAWKQLPPEFFWHVKSRLSQTGHHTMHLSQLETKQSSPPSGKCHLQQHQHSGWWSIGLDGICVMTALHQTCVQLENEFCMRNDSGLCVPQSIELRLHAQNHLAILKWHVTLQKTQHMCLKVQMGRKSQRAMEMSMTLRLSFSL